MKNGRKGGREKNVEEGKGVENRRERKVSGEWKGRGYKMEEKVENGKMKNGGERGEKRRYE